MFYLCYICNRNSNAAIAIFFLLSSSSKLSDIIVCFSHFGLIVINCPVFGVMIIFNKNGVLWSQTRMRIEMGLKWFFGHLVFGNLKLGHL